MPSSPLTIYSRITSSVAIINNLLLILLILFKSHPEVGKYKILMIYISIFEILYAILDAVGAPVASVAIIFIFGYKCYVETKKLIDPTSQSAFFNKLQSQLFYALVFQTLIPVVLMHIPASIGFITSFFNMSIEVFGNILFSTICLYPVLDPLPNFFIIKNYRDAIWKEIQTFKRWILKCKGGSTVEVQTAMTSLSREQSQTAQN